MPKGQRICKRCNNWYPQSSFLKKYTEVPSKGYYSRSVYCTRCQDFIHEKGAKAISVDQLMKNAIRLPLQDKWDREKVNV